MIFAAIIFLVGIIIFILFIVFIYFYLKKRVRKTLDNVGFSGMNIGDVIKEARLQDQIEPKSLASMDSIYLTQIKEDFPDINIDQIKRQAERTILDVYNSVENKDTSNLHGKIKSLAEDMINDYKDKNVKFNSFKFHNTVVSFYKKGWGTATIFFGSSYEYILKVDNKDTKIQDRAKTEFVYVYREENVPEELKAFGIHCPNCGSPVTDLGEKKCSYCGSAVEEIYSKVFICDDMVRY